MTRSWCMGSQRKCKGRHAEDTSSPAVHFPCIHRNMHLFCLTGFSKTSGLVLVRVSETWERKRGFEQEKLWVNRKGVNGQRKRRPPSTVRELPPSTLLVFAAVRPHHQIELPSCWTLGLEASGWKSMNLYNVVLLLSSMVQYTWKQLSSGIRMLNCE